MKNIRILMLLTSISLFAEGDFLTIKSFLTGPLKYAVTTSPQIMLEFHTSTQISFELGLGFALEEEHEGESSYSGDPIKYQNNGEYSYSFAALYNLIDHEKSDFKIITSLKHIIRSQIGYVYYYLDDGTRMTEIATHWVASNIFLIAVEPSLQITDDISCFTRFGFVGYKAPGSYYVDDDADDYPDKLTWKKNEDEAFRIGTTIETWVVGIGYTF